MTGPADSPYTAPGVAVFAPRLRLTRYEQRNDGEVEVDFEASDNVTTHAWAPRDAADPELGFSAVVQPQVSGLEVGREYIAFVVPVDALVPEDPTA